MEIPNGHENTMSKAAGIHHSKALTAAILALWAVFSLFYYNIPDLLHNYRIEIIEFKFRPIIRKVYNATFNETDEFLLNTPGCTIPNYGKTMVFKQPKAYYSKSNCEKRSVFIEPISDDEMEFKIDKSLFDKDRKNTTPYNCCYKFITRPHSIKPGVNDTEVIFSKCSPFKNGTKAKRIAEIVTVKCSDDHYSSTFYKDAYIMIKKVSKRVVKGSSKKWNVLILGMDTMSRERGRRTLPLTMQFFKNNSWLDYRAYNKIGDNTYPNLMAMLAGNANLKSNNQSMDSVNDLLMWSRYKSEGYATAYGEDNLKLPDTFKNYGGFEVQPTDHYMRPFFLLGEYVIGNKVCSRRMSSATHLLDYAHQFTRVYENDNFFGFFWINSVSHNPNYNPKLFDLHLSEFLSKITGADKNNNTFIFFLSDHGVRFGETRYTGESYYEERLPMLHIWAPHAFREKFPNEFYNLQVNQNRLVTPYDLHATLWDILKKSTDTVTVIKSKVCPDCTSLFYEKSEDRTCSEAAIDEKWCSCHQFTQLKRKMLEAKKALTTAFYALKNISSNIKTKECTKCAQTGLKSLLRVHKYINTETNRTHYVVAFLTTPGGSGYEIIVDKEDMGYKVNSPMSTITSYNIRGDCVINRAHRGYCICEHISRCQKQNSP